MTQGIIIVWIVTALLGYSRYGYMWQLKEYRLRNMRDFLRGKKGRGLLLSYLSAKNILRPRLTKKMLVILILSIVLDGLILFSLFSIWTLIALIIFRFVIISIVVGLLYIPTTLAKKLYIYKATKKLSQYKQLKSIGITGSYGKTTVKELLAHVLSTKFNVVKTPEHINTEIGIAKFILGKDFTNTDFFVVEMGAYRPKDIDIISKMVKPSIGILTAINEQHLALFGSIKKIQKTKYELLYALPKDGTAIVNSDNPLCRELLHTLKANVKTFGKDEANKPTYYLTDISTSDSEIQFSSNNENYKAPIFGEYNVMNLIPVIATAETLGISNSEIQTALSTLSAEKYGAKILHKDKAVIIDDSYNSNTEGFKEALKLLENLKKNKKAIVITRGIEELGHASREIHEQIGKSIGEVADELIVISPDNLDSLKKDLGNKTKVLTVYKAKDLLEYIKDISKTESIILLENRMFTNIDNYFNE